jgi:hypothetical protein
MQMVANAESLSSRSDATITSKTKRLKASVNGFLNLTPGFATLASECRRTENASGKLIACSDFILLLSVDRAVVIRLALLCSGRNSYIPYSTSTYVDY